MPIQDVVVADHIDLDESCADHAGMPETIAVELLGAAPQPRVAR